MDIQKAMQEALGELEETYPNHRGTPRDSAVF